MSIFIHNRQKDLSLNAKKLKERIFAIMQLEKVRGEVHFIFVTKKKITSLHEKFFHDPSPTDCISFPYDEELLGEVFICPLFAKEYADADREITLYMIHGLLHLIGYADITPKERRLMRKKEKSCMDDLERRDLFLQ